MGKIGDVFLRYVTEVINIGDPNGSRTRVSGVRGQRPRPLDDGTLYMAGERGFEPLLYGPEPHVLPLDDSPAKSINMLSKKY